MRHSVACLTACIVLCTSLATFGQNATQVPKDIQNKLEYFDGQWTGKWTYSNGDTKNEFLTRKSILGGRFALLTGHIGELDFHMVSGWDAGVALLEMETAT